MKVRVLFFATLKELAGRSELDFELEEGTRVEAFKSRLGERLPALGPALQTCLVAVNKEYAFPDEEIPPGAEIALFPPVSGGSLLHPALQKDGKA